MLKDKADIDIQSVIDEYLKKTIERLESETKFPFSSIKEIGKKLNRDLFEMVKPQYLTSQVADILRIENHVVVDITDQADMFASNLLVDRLGRLKEKENLEKNETTVFYSVLGILYLGYWRKNEIDLQSYCVLNNKKIREDIVEGMIAYEKGEMETYFAEEAIKQLKLDD